MNTLALIDDVKQICNRLAPHGWKELFLAHGLNITAADLETELGKELTNINRDISGFEDFSLAGKRAIESGKPARSLLFHAFASPNVVKGADGSNLAEFPTLAEIETIENYVYGKNPPTLPSLKDKAANDDEIAIVVFASEYRPAPETVGNKPEDRKHADMCFSRTGVARVGTADPLYDSKRRGFLPVVDGNDHAMRVLPAKYSAYIAVMRNGRNAKFGPMSKTNADNRLNFWVPIHKLFDGTECIQGLTLHATLETHHVNEKIRRVHKFFKDNGVPTEHQEPKISEPDFKFTKGIAQFSTNSNFGKGLLLPVVHSRLIEPAKHNGNKLTFQVPPRAGSRGIDNFSSSLELEAERGARHAPEYVHARHMIEPGNDEPVDLNEREKNIVKTVTDGNYRAQHYVDFTGDGWIKASCEGLDDKLPNHKSAYSIVTAPDFFTNCDQRELVEWEKGEEAAKYRGDIWGQGGRPFALSDDRSPANIQSFKAEFDEDDKTMTAIVSSLEGPDQAQQLDFDKIPKTSRHSWLPDAASGVFAPGWDVSLDQSDGILHLATYGLGSPFPEDAKLCAALSTFWPSASPDAARTFEQSIWPTVSPLTDEELGLGHKPSWDGVSGPKRIGGSDIVEYTSFDHADYVTNALENKFSLALTNKVDINEYQSRTLAMVRVYDALGFMNRKNQLRLLSFSKTSTGDDELREAQQQAGEELHGTIFRFEVYTPRAGNPEVSPNDHKKQRIQIKELWTIFVGKNRMLIKKGAGAWTSKNV